ncbi:erythromycin esterase family protein [Pedobacter frigoris]|uniref:Erythromycin esterase family protein n=1 Tax=Pedobacter frigoris TaxID=2571272 RepID=A0A4U1CLD8_9SPHI|nr:erythromycin esterase family protein [Pedobacter frigoris]TKC07111.1 erythromycin esterase family protein [Pedobacter frigoris]
MKSLQFNAALIVLFSFLFPWNLSAQEDIKQIISSLDKVIKPVKTLKPDSSFDDIAFLKETIKDREIIALGEATHGTLEIYNYKDRLVRFLVSESGYRAIGFEADHIALEYIDEYIAGKTDSLKFQYGANLINTNRRMFEWLRSYNLTKVEEDKVHVYGLEVRNFGNIINRILQVIPSITDSDRQLLEKIKGKRYNEIKKDDINALRASINDMKKVTDNGLHQHYLNLLDQLIDAYKEQKIGMRDQVMADNTTWIKDQAKNNKVIVWVHNGHVAKTALYKNPTMGTYLDKKYGSKYFVIATDINYGKVHVNIFTAKNKPLGGFQPLYYAEVNSDKAYEYYFKQCQFKNFILDVGSAKNDPVLNSFLTKPKDMRMIGSLSIPDRKNLSIAKNFDMIVYFNSTNSMFN